MDINYQDKNLLVFYIQIFLNEYFGLTARLNSENKYEVTDQEKVEVTGYHTVQTYTSIALWMAYNYPNEGYPYLWSSEPDPETSELKWKYSFSDFSGMSSEEVVTKTLSIIEENINNFYTYNRCLEIPDRVISYIFNEVVTPSSSPEEIIRAKYLILGDPVVTRYTYKYDQSFMDRVSAIQNSFMLRHTVGEEYQAPPGFERFHVTGYLDPWTEVIAKGLID